MNFLLVVPQFVFSGEYYSFPFGLGYVSSFLKSKGFNVFCLNLCHYDQSISLENILKEHITNNKIDVFCTGTLSFYWNKVDEILKIAKKIKPEIITVVGGAIVISDPKLALENLDIDIAVMGEGEETMAELADVLCRNGSIETVKGLAFLKNKEVIKTPERPYIENLDSLPFPDYEGFEFEKWTSLVIDSENFDVLDRCENLHYTEFIGSRSCPFSCTFCYHHLGQKYRQRSLDNIFKEIDYLIKEYDINFFYFLDELFSANHQRMIDFAERIKNYNIIGWGGSFRVNDVDSEILKTLKISGLKYIGYGLENINDEILVSMKKRTTKAEIENALKLTREAGISCSGNIIFGDPSETEETAKNSLRWWLNNPQYNIVPVFLRVIPNSPIFQLAIKNNLIKDRLKHVTGRFPTINMTKLSEGRFYKLMGKIIWQKNIKKQLKLGKLTGAVRASGQKKKDNLYLITTQCPFCGRVSEYKKPATNSMYTHFYCEHCTSQHKIFSYKIFGKDHSILMMTGQYLFIFLSTHLIRFDFYRKNGPTIIPFLIRIKRIFKFLFKL